MKRIFCVFLALSMLICTTAVTASEPVVEIDGLKFNVSLEYANPPRKAAIQVLDENKTKLWYNGEVEVVDGLAVFDTFSLPKTIPTGSYIVRCTNDGSQNCEIVVQVANVYEKINAFNELASAEGSGYRGIIGDGVIFGVDASLYQDEIVSGELLALINTHLSSFDWYVGEEGEYLEEKQSLFKKEFNTCLEYIYVLSAQDAEKMSELKYLTPDISDYFKILSEDEFLKRMKSCASEVDALSEEDVYKAFDEAVLLASIVELDWASVQSAVEYYEDKGIVTLDYTKYNNLNSTNKSNAWKNLKKQTINNCAEIPEKFLSITQSLYNSQKSSGNSGTGGRPSGSVNTVSGIQIINPSVTTTEEPAADEVFSDMADYQWAQTAVNTLHEKGIIAGKGAGKFAPADYVTREEFVKLAVLLLDLPASNDVSFSDISDDDWCREYVAAATSSGIVTGVGDGRFGKGNHISREDMTVILHRCASYADIALGSVRSTGFEDADEISGYALSSVKLLADAGIINGVGDNYFAPDLSVTRAEAAKAIYEIYCRLEGVK